MALRQLKELVMTGSSQFRDINTKRVSIVNLLHEDICQWTRTRTPTNKHMPTYTNNCHVAINRIRLNVSALVRAYDNKCNLDCLTKSTAISS
jgi:hypothetical protein